LLDVAKASPRRVSTAPCQEIVETVNPSVSGLPILKCWPGDGGRYITLPAVFTRDPVTGARNVGMYRLQVFDDRTLGMHWQTHKGGAEHQHRATARMPVAIALGGDPAMVYAASAPLPPGIDEVVFAGWLRGEGVELVPCRTIELELPAQAENMPAEGVFHNMVIVSIKKRYPGQARKVMQALWGMGLMMLAKTIVVVSEHVNVHDLSEVAWRATGNIDPKRDLVILEGPMDDLDHAALRHRYGGKLGVDATEKGPLDEVAQAWPDEIRMSDDVRDLVTRRWTDYGL